MSHNSIAFDQWIRSGFRRLNTELETLYSAQDDRANIEGVGDELKEQLVAEGKSYIISLLEEGNTDKGFDAAFDVLGNVGMYMAACRRHEITEPSRESTSPLKDASALALHLGASLGVTPRFATSHVTTWNRSIDGVYKTFTNVPDEFIFLDYNTRGVFAYKRAADALVRTLPMGISHPVTYDLLRDARIALEDVAKYNDILYDKLDSDGFFYKVRPYYKPFRVGRHEYRGANAGDFAGVNEIDMLLGLCQANNLSYSQLLVDKFLFMMPEDQARLRDLMRRTSLLNRFLECDEAQQKSDWYQTNCRIFLDTCKAHGHTARQHHDQLVKRFIEKPSTALKESQLVHITASGPPLPVLLDSLEKLKDLRIAAPRDDIPSRYRDFERLEATLHH
jgi:hypothetical protein